MKACQNDRILLLLMTRAPQPKSIAGLARDVNALLHVVRG